MPLTAFKQAHIYERQAAPKEKHKSIIQCLECYDRNVYMGTRDSLVQHLILSSSMNGELDAGLRKTREGRVRKLGSSNPVTQLRAVPVFNHLLVLWDRCVSALNMFSLEPIPALKKIQHVSSFEVCKSSLTAQSQAACVEMVTSSSRRKVIQIHMVGVDRWEAVREVSLPQDPVALAVDGASICVATSDRYLLCNSKSGNSVELCPHNHSRQNALVTSAGEGEFLLNGPGSLGMFVMKTGICQRPPLQWPEELLAAGVCFPYILTLQPQVLSVYSMLDQKLKQTVSLSGARGLLSTSVFTERDIISLSLVPLEEQIQALVRHDRVEEALLLLDGVQSHLPLDSYKELHKAITCLAGFIQFYQEAFSEARDLFIKGELDPKEIIRLYPGMASCLDEAFQSQPVQVRKARDLHELWQEDRSIFLHYLDFLGDFLRAIRGTEQGMKSSKEVDCALLRLYAEQGDTDNLEQLVASPNACRLDLCVPVLQQHKRFFALGSLYQSHRMQANAIKTWMKITDGQLDDPSCSDVYEHIVRTLSQLEDRDAVWTFADWTLQRNQEVPVHISYSQFNCRGQSCTMQQYGINIKTEYQGEKYVQTEVESNIGAIRGKLRQLLWDSVYYDISTVYERVKSTALHTERAILLGRAGEYSQALQVLVHQERDPCAAEAFCCRASQGQGTQLRLTLLLTLLNIYLSSEDLTSAAVDLLNRNPHVFAPQTVLQLLPGSWSLQLVSQFLVGALRETSHQRRMGRLQRALAQADSICFFLCVCKKDFTELQFVCNLRGELIHTSCSGYTAS
uniref:Si:ch211-266g18.9 n=1 Tax=Myripristis murdjan TaxID=586833 RepID=A0A667XJ36_9TELE